MSASIHNPDQYMSELRTILAQGRKRIGFLIGAGAPAGIRDPASGQPLIPAIAELTSRVLKSVPPKFNEVIAEAVKQQPDANIEFLLSKFRSLSRVIGDSEIGGMTGADYDELSQSICKEIGNIVNVNLPEHTKAYDHLVNWVSGASRRHPIEIFTTNYDLLIEEALERSKVSYFDGFSGSRIPFFDPVTTANNDLPARIVRLWKIHGSLGWDTNDAGETVRTGGSSSTNMIYPEHLKYDQTQKAPYAALFDRLERFLRNDDALLIGLGFSFADAHIAARIDEALAANPSAAVFAFQFKSLSDEATAAEVGLRRPNFSVFARDRAVINGIDAPWSPGDLPSRDWAPIRAGYWHMTEGAGGEFKLGDFTSFSEFLAMSKSSTFAPAVSAAEPTEGSE